MKRSDSKLRRDVRCRAGRLGHDPFVDGVRDLRRIEIRARVAAVHFAEARGVPQLGREIAVGLDARGADAHVAALPGRQRQREAQRIGAVFVDQFQRVDDIAFGLRHLHALFVKDAGMDEDFVERHVVHHMQAHHHHPGNPEEDDVEAGDEH